MSELALLILLVIAFAAGLLLIPFGLPGLWLIVLALVAYAIATGFATVGWGLLVPVVLVVVAAEIFEAWIGFKMAKRYGGSSRAGWGALAGGLVGALLGTPVPIVGNVVGAFLGAFAGAAVFEATRHGEVGRSLGAGWGAVLGRAAAAATKMTLGLVIAILGLFAALA